MWPHITNTGTSVTEQRSAATLWAFTGTHLIDTEFVRFRLQQQSICQWLEACRPECIVNSFFYIVSLAYPGIIKTCPTNELLLVENIRNTTLQIRN